VHNILAKGLPLADVAAIAISLKDIRPTNLAIICHAEPPAAPFKVAAGFLVPFQNTLVAYRSGFSFLDIPAYEANAHRPIADCANCRRAIFSGALPRAVRQLPARWL
jgi:hypothetical protein